MNTKKIIYLNLPEPLYEKVTEISMQNGNLSVSATIRLIIAQFGTEKEFITKPQKRTGVQNRNQKPKSSNTMPSVFHVGDMCPFCKDIVLEFSNGSLICNKCGCSVTTPDSASAD